MTRSATVAVALVLGALLVVGGAAALASRGGGEVAVEVPAQGAGSGDVRMSPDAAASPAAAQVLAQLQRHYDAINGRDYQGWKGTVVPERAAALAEDEWRAAYDSTQDGTIQVQRIDVTPDGGLLVRVRFISTQDASKAPPDLPAERICWRSTLPMRGTPPLIDLTGGGSSAREAC